MEEEGATVLWNTSIQRQVWDIILYRSRWMVSDGDSKGFNAVENTIGLRLKNLIVWDTSKNEWKSI